MTEPRRLTRRASDILLSWDNLGFRLLVFGSLALVWVIQGLLSGQPWHPLLLNEFGGLLPWAFLAPLVVVIDARIERARLSRLGVLAAHLVGMVVAFGPYWLMVRTISFGWRSFTSGWALAHFSAFVPSAQNLVAALLNVPFLYFVVLLGVAAMKQARARQDEALAAGQLARQLSDARLALLQRQLHPHFLFNALQAISTLIHRDPAAADRLLVRLSSLLRAMLDEASDQTLTLRTELDLVRKYVEIEQVRFGDRLAVSWDIDEAALDHRVPSLVVLPLVDNAVRHGLSPKVGPCRLTITVAAVADGLCLRVEDDGVGAAAPLATGLGIGNTRERLRALYGDAARLDVDTAPGQGFRACLTLPLPEGRR